jgi:thermostable 8-oxoguanine DNA glycosylase
MKTNLSYLPKNVSLISESTYSALEMTLMLPKNLVHTHENAINEFGLTRTQKGRYMIKTTKMLTHVNSTTIFNTYHELKRELMVRARNIKINIIKGQVAQLELHFLEKVG